MVERLERLILDTPVYAVAFGLLLGVGAFAADAADVLGKDLAEPAKYAGAVIAGLSAVWKVVKETVVRRHKVRRLLVRHPAPCVHEVRPTDVGVADSQIAKQLTGSDEPPYVDRNIDGQLEGVLASQRFVVVRGRPKAGKSRAAFHAVQRACSDWRLVAVHAGRSVAEVVELGVLPSKPTVLWLDRIDGFLRNGGLGPGVRDEILNRKTPVCIVGTIENAAWSSILGPEAAEYEAAETLRSAFDVHLLAATPDELAHASEVYGVAFEGGIGEFLVAVPETRRAYDGAKPRELTAVVRAVADWQRAGMQGGIGRPDLEELAFHYLNGADPGDWFKQGLDWANTEVAPGVRLIVAEGPSKEDLCYRVPDHLVAHIVETEDAPIQKAAWEVALARATAPDALAVASRALEAASPHVAERALQQAYATSRPKSPTHVTAAGRLGLLLRRQRRDDEAEKFYREAVAGKDNSARNNYGYMLLKQGRLGDAEAVLRKAVRAGNRTAAFNLLETLAKADRLDEASSAFELAARHGNAAAALMLGNVEHAAGNLKTAEAWYRKAEQGTRKRDKQFAARATMLRALLAHDRNDDEEAFRLLRSAWDEEQWGRTTERLDQVGLEQLRATMQELLKVYESASRASP